ncbi:MAG: 2-hydroxyacid dehydrogenase [Limisphaerales bacterium]
MSQLPKVLFTLNVPGEHLSPLDGIADLLLPNTHEWNALTKEQLFSSLGECEAFISQGEVWVDAEFLDAAPKLRMVANAAMGVDNLDLPELTRRGIKATNTPDAFAESTADLTFGLILSVTRRIAESDRFIRTGEWEKNGMQPLRWEGSLVGGKTLGIIGYGRIAKLVEKRAAAFGLNVIHTRQKLDDHPQCRTFDILLAESDIIVTQVPLTEATRRLIDAKALAAMKPGAVLVNVARGKVMDEAAVAEALNSGHLAGAGFDVFEEEPKVHPALFEMDNVVLTPHLGGATNEERQRGRREAAEEVARFLRGEPVLYPVN